MPCASLLMMVRIVPERSCGDGIPITSPHSNIITCSDWCPHAICGEFLPDSWVRSVLKLAAQIAIIHISECLYCYSQWKTCFQAIPDTAIKVRRAPEAMAASPSQNPTGYMLISFSCSFIEIGGIFHRFS